MKLIENKRFPFERDLYNQRDLKLLNCRFEGVEDGESALKECKNLELENCYMDLRYPLWHDNYVILNHCEQTPNCRASLWYSNHITINNSNLNGIKALRECQDITIFASKIESQEFGWKSNNIKIDKTFINSQYIFFLAKNIKVLNSKFAGKYGFQYIEDAEFNNCVFDTKDAFWHAKNITVKDSVIKGEYLGWYSENLTFVNCLIEGIQPLCYCKGLKLINCKMINTNLAFEYSNVEADIIGNIESIKNPLSGVIKVDSIDEIVMTDDTIYECCANIIIKSKKM